MTSKLDTLARCHLLALAAMQQVAADAPLLRAVPAAPLPLRRMGRADPMAPAAFSRTEVELLAAFTPKARARILAVLDRLCD